MSARDVLADYFASWGDGHAMGDAIITALSAAGYVVVPLVETDAMYAAGNRIWGESVAAIYRAMITAANPPILPKG